MERKQSDLPLPCDQRRFCFSEYHTLLTPCALAFWLLALQVVASVLVFCFYDYSRLVSCSDTVAQKTGFVENLMSFTGDTTFISGQLRVA